jgi:cell division protein ZapA
MARPVTVTIAGQRYTLKSDGDEVRVRKIAGYVDARIREVAQKTRTQDSQAHAILAALQIAEELFAARESGAELKRRVQEKGRALLRFLEQKAGV